MNTKMITAIELLSKHPMAGDEPIVFSRTDDGWKAETISAFEDLIGQDALYILGQGSTPEEALDDFIEELRESIEEEESYLEDEDD